MKAVLYFVVLILGCYGQGFRGYYYPKPSCPLQLPVTYTETQTRTQVYSTDATVYQTQYYTNTVSVPVYITSTVVTERLVTSYATIVSPVPQYFTETSTLYITPSPVVVYSTIVSTATLCADVSADGLKEVDNTYLPPQGESQGANAIVDDFKQTVDNTYLPPDPSGTSGSGGSAFQRSSARANPFDTRRARFILPLGALPPSV